MKVPGFSNAYALASPVWDYRCPDLMSQRALFVKKLLPLGLHPHSNKAVAQGAIAFFLDAIVTSRVSRHEYGIQVSVPYKPNDVQHAVRSSRAVFMADGIKRLPDAFSTILDEVCCRLAESCSRFLTRSKGIRVSEMQEFRGLFFRFSESRRSLDQIKVTIKAYKGSSRNPHWIDCDPGQRVSRLAPYNFLTLVSDRFIF